MSLVGGFCWASAEEGHAGDIGIKREGGQIVTGLLGDDEEIFPYRVFSGELGDDEPFFGADPGYDAEADVFPVDSRVGFNIRGALLQFDPVSGTFGSTPHTMSVQYQDGPNLLKVTTGSGFVPGFDLGMDDEGEWHYHFGYLLNPDASDPDAIGVYALRLELFTDMSGVGKSDEYWIVWNNGDTEENHDAAIDAAFEVVPEPGTMIALGAGLAALAARRRRRN